MGRKLTGAELTKLLKAKQALDDLLESLLDRQELYREEFLQGLAMALKEVQHKKTRRVGSLEEFLS